MMETNFFRPQREKLFCTSMALNYRIVLNLLTYTTGRPGYPWNLSAVKCFSFRKESKIFCCTIFFQLSNF